jgi:triosephosphate isomerase
MAGLSIRFEFRSLNAMAKRKPVVGGNWKMNLHGSDADALVDALIKGAPGVSAEVVICPAFPYLDRVGKKLRDAKSAIKLGAQDLYPAANGAFTGEVSVSMLKDLGVQVVLTGHSERRHVISETDALINAKTRAALDGGLEVILCIGEKLEQREAGQTDFINIGQLYLGLAGVKPEQMSRVIIAYEPVWAIGTGKTATAADAQSAHIAIRKALANMYGQQIADSVRIQYGGSVKGSNAGELFGQADIDGGLIGGASLKADEFLTIVKAAV